MLAREGEKEKEKDDDFEKGLSDKDMGKIILWQLSEGLSKIDASQPPGNYKKEGEVCRTWLRSAEKVDGVWGCTQWRWEPEALWADQHHACSRTWDYEEPHWADPPKSSLRKRRKQATGSGWNDETRLRHLIRFCCRGCQREIPVHCPATRRRSGLRGETSMSGGLQLKTLQQNHTVCSQV